MNKIIGSSIKWITKTGSTNNYAANALLTERPAEGTVFVTNSQYDGRGQASSRWESEPDKNLTFSIILYPDFIEISNQFEISKMISLGVADFLKDKTGEITIKWPNDIYIGDRKAAGILIENSVRIKSISSCIVGIGLNINQQVFSNDLPNPVSLGQVTGQTYDLVHCLDDLCLKMDARYNQLMNRSFSRIDQDYVKMLYRLGEWSLYTDKNGTYEGRILGVDRTGQLQIEALSGKINRYQFKEVIFVND